MEKKGELEIRVGRHKKISFSFEDSIVPLSESSSNRPFWTLNLSLPGKLVDDADSQRELWHAYIAMGVQDEFQWQSSILFRCYHCQAAVDLITILHQDLNLSVYVELLHDLAPSPVESGAFTKQTSEAMRALEEALFGNDVDIASYEEPAVFRKT